MVALRADEDDLPVQGASDVDLRSEVNGVTHTYGHDTHMAMLLGAARLLSEHREELDGTVKFLFQPEEEYGGTWGAMPMISAASLAMFAFEFGNPGGTFPER